MQIQIILQMSQIIDTLCEAIHHHTNRAFKYISTLGKGGSAQVFLVQSDKQEQLALKLIHLHPLKDQTQQRIFQEIEVMAHLQHPHILAYRGHFFIKHKLLCIFTSYCQGGSLADNLKPLPSYQIKTWMGQLSDALAFIHQQGIIHQDIKLQNIFVQGNSLKIGDFGLATKIQDSAVQLSAFRGTPYYMAPQSLQRKLYSPASDVWGLGLVFLELTLGKRIHHMLQGAQIPCRRPNFPEELLQKVQQPEMRTLIGLMLKRTPSSRPTASEVNHYLFNPGSLTCQPEVNVHLRSSRCHSELKVIKYSDTGVWQRTVVCEVCGKEATLKREVPLDSEKENLMDRLKISRERLYKAGYGAKWECGHCAAKGFWLTFQQ